MIVMRALTASTLPSPSRRTLLAAGGLGALGLALSACSPGGGADGRPRVIVGCYGIEYVAALVAGDAAEVVSLAKPGQEPHGVELSVAESALIERADVIIQIPGFQGALDDLIASRSLQDAVLDVSTVVEMLPGAGADEHEHAGASDAGGEHDQGGEDEGGEHAGHDHGGLDPHLWHDPTLLARIASALADRLAAASRADAATFAANADAARETLTALDQELQRTYGAVPGERLFVTSHTAFAYLAHRYGLEQVGISGIDPEVEPSPQRLLELQRVIRERGVSTVFFEESASPKVARTLAENVGVAAESLDNLETRLDDGADYPAVMRRNAEKLVASWA